MTSVVDFAQGPYAWVLLGSLVISIQVLLVGFSAGSVRGKLFTKEFFARNFPELKGSVPPEGYPDSGNGKFAKKLTLTQWQDFNNAQRAHMNYVEGVATALVTFLVAGLFQPRLIALLTLQYIVGRALYAAGYKTAGANGRKVGAAVQTLSLFAAWGIGVYSAFQAAGGVKGVTDFAQQIVAHPTGLWL